LLGHWVAEGSVRFERLRLSVTVLPEPLANLVAVRAAPIADVRAVADTPPRVGPMRGPVVYGADTIPQERGARQDHLT
jgi:hypothetical protein